MLGCEHDSPIIVGQSPAPVAGLATGVSPIIVKADFLGIELERHVEIVNCATALAFVFAQAGTGGVGRGDARVESNGRVIILESPITQPEPREHFGAVEVGHGVFGCELDRLAQVGDGLVVLPDREVGKSAIGIKAAAFSGIGAQIARDRSSIARSYWPKPL